MKMVFLYKYILLPLQITLVLQLVTFLPRTSVQVSVAYLHENHNLFEQTHINKKQSNMFSSFKFNTQFTVHRDSFFSLYGRFLNLRVAGGGVPMVELSRAHPEVTQTPGGPLRPGCPLRPGRPTCPRSPCFPGCPLKALPGRPC